jgi:acetate kinase
MSSVLTINGGSSSIRFAIFAAAQPPKAMLRGKMDRIGSADASLSIDHVEGGTPPPPIDVKLANHRTAVDFLMGWLQSQPLSRTLGAVGHRVVHGMQHSRPERVTDPLLDELRRIIPFDPEHLPREIELIEAFQRRYPKWPQVACFDTAFHRSMPPVATQVSIPRRLAVNGVQRYGFHGLSYTYLIEELARLGDPAATKGRVILAHLGNGASLAAVRDGKSIDTSMGFTPAAGLVMGTRTGDLDPGLMCYLGLQQSLDATQLQHLVNHESGLLGISETSSDVRDLLDRESRDPRASEALALFCYQAKKWIGSYAAALGGLDTLVFAGGIGENSAPVRRRICEGLEFLGIQIDDTENDRHAARISTKAGAVSVRIIPTDEESVIANLTLQQLAMAAPT